MPSAPVRHEGRLLEGSGAHTIVMHYFRFFWFFCGLFWWSWSFCSTCCCGSFRRGCCLFSCSRSFSCGSSLGSGRFLCRSCFLWWFGLSWFTTKDVTKYMKIHIIILSLGRSVHLVFWWQTIWK